MRYRSTSVGICPFRNELASVLTGPYNNRPRPWGVVSVVCDLTCVHRDTRRIDLRASFVLPYSRAIIFMFPGSFVRLPKGIVAQGTADWILHGVR
jgi:hypothetical protein